MKQRHKLFALGAAFCSGMVCGVLAMRRLRAAIHRRPDAPRRVEPAPQELVSSHNPPDQGPNVNPVDRAGGSLAPQQELDPMKIACAQDFQDWDEMGCWG